MDTPGALPPATLLVMAEEERDIGAELRAATDLLKAVVRDRSLLGALTEEERAELVSAAADVFNPDIVQRRLWGKALRRNEKAPEFLVTRDQIIER